MCPCSQSRSWWRWRWNTFLRAYAIKCASVPRCTTDLLLQCNPDASHVCDIVLYTQVTYILSMRTQCCIYIELLPIPRKCLQLALYSWYFFVAVLHAVYCHRVCAASRRCFSHVQTQILVFIKPLYCNCKKCTCGTARAWLSLKRIFKELFQYTF